MPAAMTPTGASFDAGLSSPPRGFRQTRPGSPPCLLRARLLFRLAVQDGDGVPVVILGALVAVADADGAYLAVLGEGADEVEDHALLGRAVEVEAVVHGDVDQVVGGQALVVGTLEVVGGVVVAGFGRRGAVQAVVRVVGAVGQEAQDQVRVRGAALPQVDLDGGMLPTFTAPDRDEVDGEPPEGAAFPEHLPHPLSSLLYITAVLGVRGKSATEEDLAGRPAQDLIVRGDDGRIP